MIPRWKPAYALESNEANTLSTRGTSCRTKRPTLPYRRPRTDPTLWAVTASPDFVTSR